MQKRPTKLLFSRPLSKIKCELYFDALSSFIPFGTYYNIIQSFGTSANLNTYLAIIIAYEYFCYDYDLEKRDKYMEDIIESVKSLPGISPLGKFIKNLQSKINVFGKRCSTETCTSIFSSRKSAKIDGRFFLSWNYVTFYKGSISLQHPLCPNNYTNIPLKGSQTAFNQVKQAFISSLPPIYVNSKKGRISGVVDQPVLADCIETIVYKTTGAKQTKVSSEDNFKRLSHASDHEIVEYIKEKDSEYLNYLCNRRMRDVKIIYTQEFRASVSSLETNTLEDAFLFTMEKNVLVYENALPAHSSVVFIIEPTMMEDAKNEICTFFASSECNKREKLMNRSISFTSDAIKSYHRVMHNDFNSWQADIFYILCRNTRRTV